MFNLKYDEMRKDFNEGKVKEKQVFILTENFFDQIQDPCVYYKIGEPIVKTYLAIGMKRGYIHSIILKNNKKFRFYSHKDNQQDYY